MLHQMEVLIGEKDEWEGHLQIADFAAIHVLFQNAVHRVSREQSVCLQALPVFLEILIFHLAACHWSVFWKWLLSIPFWIIIPF